MIDNIKDKLSSIQTVDKNNTNNKVKNKSINLYPSQEIAIQQLEDWYKSNDLFCTLEGYAGTGKTFIMKYFIENIINKSWTISAPTHKALRILELIVGYKGKTIHGLLGLKPNVDLSNFDPTNPQFDQLKDLKINNYNIVLIDECSMINTGLFNRIIKIANTYKIKILFIGDSYQLPPVNEEISPTFKSILRKVVLNKIVRQAEGNPIIELSSLIRNDILNNGNSFLNHIVKNKNNIVNGKGYELLFKNEFSERCLNEIKSDNFIGNKDKNINTNIDHLRMLCYTNNTVSNWNKYIRDNFLGNNIPMVSINDLFMSYNTILNEFSEPIILNSEDYIVYDLVDYISDEGIKTFGVNLQSMYDERKTDPFLIVDHNDRSFSMYKKMLTILYHNGIKKQGGGWKAYYNFKNRFLTLVPVSITDPYGNERIVKKDIDYGFGLSVHKSQGSTFDNVAIDLTDLVWYTYPNGNTREYNRTMRNKLIYVALTRAKNKAILKY